MTKWTLLVFIFFAWLLCLIPALLEKMIQNAQLPLYKRGGVSIVPIIPFAPLLLWGIAMGIDYVISPWGTRIIGGLHVALAFIAIVFAFKYLLQLRAEK